MSIRSINFYSNIMNSINTNDLKSLQNNRTNTNVIDIHQVISKNANELLNKSAIQNNSQVDGQSPIQSSTELTASSKLFSNRLFANPPYLFSDTSTQSYVNRESASLFSIKSQADYWKQMCLLNPHYFGTDWKAHMKGLVYEYDPNSIDFSKTCPSGKDYYTKPIDGGSHDKIAVIDCFDSNKSAEIMTLDETTDTIMPHGEVVSLIIESQIKENNLNYSVDRMDVDLDDGVMNGGVEALDYIMENIEDYRAINVSICDYCDYDLVSLVVGKEVTPDNLADYKQTIMEAVMSEDVQQMYDMYDVASGYLPDLSEEIKNGVLTEEQVAQIEAILTLRYKVDSVGEFYAKADAIAASGIPVFMAAGNDDKCFNFGALLTSNVEYIGAAADVDDSIKDIGYSENSLVSRYGQETFTGNKVINGKIDLDGNGTGDIDATGVDTSTFGVTGTSFSSPYTLVQVLAESDKYAQEQREKEINEFRNSMNLYELVRYHRSLPTLVNYQTSSGNTGDAIRFTSDSLTSESGSTKSSAVNYSSSNKTNDNIINKLNSNVNYNTSGNNTKAETTTFEKLRNEIAKTIDPRVLQSGSEYYKSGAGSLNRFKKPDMSQDKYYGRSFKDVRAEIKAKLENQGLI